jgi:hypothetical protein
VSPLQRVKRYLLLLLRHRSSSHQSSKQTNRSSSSSSRGLGDLLPLMHSLLGSSACS